MDSHNGDEDQDLDWEEWDPQKNSFVNHMLAGSVAGLAEHVAIFPVDTIKTHVQCERCGSLSPFKTWSCAERLVKKEGVFRLWRGVSAMFVGCVPAHAAYFSLYEYTKRVLGADRVGHHPAEAAVSGAVAALGHDLFMTPFDTIKQRMQLGHYKGVGHCIRNITASEGLSAFYVSLPTTLLMNLPYGCIMVAVNESTRKVICPSGRYDVSTTLFAGAVAGATAATLTNPLDVIKTRLQTQSLKPLDTMMEPCPQTGQSSVLATNNRTFMTLSAPKPSLEFHRPKYAGALEACVNIYRSAGFAGFASGIFARVLVHAPSVAVSWTAYETAKQVLQKLEL